MSGLTISYDVGQDKAAIVKYFYDQENDHWFHRVHKRGGTREECIADTLNSISEGSIIYVVYTGEELAAFFVKNTDCQSLEGFHVLHKFRNKLFLTAFWASVRARFGDDIFYTGIYCKNEPALKTLNKAGFVAERIVEYNNQIFILFKSR